MTTGALIHSIYAMLTSYTLYATFNCTGFQLGSFAYNACYNFTTPPGGMIYVTDQSCSIPVPPPPPVPAPAPVTPPPDPTNCIYFWASNGCAGNLAYYYNITCGSFCNTLTGSLSTSTNCNTNFTGVFSDPSCLIFLTSAGGACTNIAPTSGYRSFNITYGTVCPPLQIITPTPFVPTPTPTPAGLFCLKTYSFPGCSLSLGNTTIGSCQQCSNGMYLPDCAGNNITRWSPGVCSGSIIASFQFGQCYNDGLGFSRVYYLDSCPPPPPPPPPSILNQTCASFALSNVLCQFPIIQEPYPQYCFNSSFVYFPSGFFDSSPYKSFWFNCQTGFSLLYVTQNCTGPSASFFFLNPLCQSFAVGPNYQMSTNNASCATCICKNRQIV